MQEIVLDWCFYPGQGLFKRISRMYFLVVSYDLEGFRATTLLSPIFDCDS
jgi:hypothetical protein